MKYKKNLKRGLPARLALPERHTLLELRTENNWMNYTSGYYTEWKSNSQPLRLQSHAVPQRNYVLIYVDNHQDANRGVL